MSARIIGAIAALSLAAATAAVAGPAERQFARIDADGDGRIAIADALKRHEDRLRQADADRDGFLTQAELRARLEARRDDRGARPNPDVNGDGSVDRGEFEKAARARFDRLDTDRDGRLSAEERRAFGRFPPPPEE